MNSCIILKKNKITSEAYTVENYYGIGEVFVKATDLDGNEIEFNDLYYPDNSLKKNRHYIVRKPKC